MLSKVTVISSQMSRTSSAKRTRVLKVLPKSSLVKLAALRTFPSVRSSCSSTDVSHLIPSNRASRRSSYCTHAASSTETIYGTKESAKSSTLITVVIAHVKQNVEATGWRDCEQSLPLAREDKSIHEVAVHFHFLLLRPVER